MKRESAVGTAALRSLAQFSSASRGMVHVVVVVGLVLSATLGGYLARRSPDVTGSETPVATSSRPSPRVAEERFMTFPATSGWPAISVASCAALHLTGDTVVRVPKFDGACLLAVSPDFTTVFVTPYSSQAPLGGTWLSQTRPWKEVDGHSVRRLSDGPLMALSSRYVDALVCSSCDEVVVAVGSVPAVVRTVIESFDD